MHVKGDILQWVLHQHSSTLDHKKRAACWHFQHMACLPWRLSKSRVQAWWFPWFPSSPSLLLSSMHAHAYLASKYHCFQPTRGFPPLHPHPQPVPQSEERQHRERRRALPLFPRILFDVNRSSTRFSVLTAPVHFREKRRDGGKEAVYQAQISNSKMVLGVTLFSSLGRA